MAVPPEVLNHDLSLSDLGQQPKALLEVYRAMCSGRTVDRIEQELCAGGEAFFHVGGAGHEAAAALSLFFEPQDWLHLHYRDKALSIARGATPQQWFDSSLCNANNESQGRQMACFTSSAELNLPSPPIPVGANALQAVGIAQEIIDQPGNPIVLCGIGDGGVAQGEFMEAVAHAVREQLPVLFWIQDNGYAISTTTQGKTFYNLPGFEDDRFFGLDMNHFDGRDILKDIPRIGELVGEMRKDRGPRIGVMHIERLCSHSNADDQRVYREEGVLEEGKTQGDPIINFRQAMIAAGVDAAKLDEVEAQVEKTCRDDVERARRIGDGPTLHTASRELPEHLAPGTEASEYHGDPEADEQLTMIQAMRNVLGHRLETDPRVTLFGEDIEDPKGDVFGVTKGLSTRFPGRVVNSPLAESTIIGSSIGRALAGGRPVGFIQFADFLPTGIGQVMTELGSIHWRTGGQFDAPVILMITCGAYRPGLGPFHSQTMEAFLAHIPGLDVMMPSSASDAAAMLNAAFESNRPTIFLYPKVCLNDRTPWKLTSDDVDKQITPVGSARTLTEGGDLTLVTWGSTVSLGMGVAEKLKTVGVDVELIDLRCIVPWDKEKILRSARKTGHLLVVHEDNHTGGFGGEVLATVSEALGKRVAVKRVTRCDTWIPCNYPNQMEILPSYRGVLTAACELIGMDIAWPIEDHAEEDGKIEVLEAQGSSPADQAVTVSVWKVKEGDRVSAGQIIADMEADKATFEVAAPCDGVVAQILVEADTNVPVDTPLMKIRRDADEEGERVVKRITREDLGHPVITRPELVTSSVSEEAAGQKVKVYLSPIHIAEGRNRLPNSVLERRFPNMTSDDIVKRTGIESRPILARDQTALSIGVEAARKALESEGLTLADLTGIVCHTTTPPLNTPSMACMILRELDPKAEHEVMVYDVNAACSGWLYALDTAYNSIVTQPNKAVLCVTTEALSRVVDPEDFDTVILFGDAATATIVRGTTEDKVPSPHGSPMMVLERPVLSGKSDLGDILTVGFQGQSHIHMDGKKVFTEAVRAMTRMTRQAFDEAGMSLDDVDWLIPHQANRRIFEAVRSRLSVPPEKVIDLIAQHGNTSSSSIPLSMAKSAEKFSRGDTLGICAFGGGFTFGAALMKVE